MLKAYLTALLLTLSLSSAQAEDTDLCYTGEINPATKKIYTSHDDWALDLETWNEKEPAHPGMLRLWRAYSVYKEQEPIARKLKNDKRQHCYMGCMISQTTNQETVLYVAWLKESRDLQDCSKATHFEEADFIATLFGAQVGATAKTAQECVDSCQNPL